MTTRKNKLPSILLALKLTAREALKVIYHLAKRKEVIYGQNEPICGTNVMPSGVEV